MLAGLLLGGIFREMQISAMGKVPYAANNSSNLIWDPDALWQLN